MSSAPEEIGPRTLRRIAWRIIPMLGVLYFVAFLDRVNIGFAALTMNDALGLTPAMFGLASGIFFLGYVLFEVPSNLIMERVGARLWIARIMITWGLLSAGTAFVQTPQSLYVLRFLLGIAEAGFFPGMILYLTYWFPASWRARILGAFMVALPISSMIGAPLSTALLSVEGLGFSGWQWMFLIEGVPAILCGAAVLLLMRDGPAQAAWLTDEERRWLHDELARERAAAQHTRVGAALREPRVWSFGAIYFGLLIGLYGFGFWLPQIIKGLGDLSNVEVGALSSLPYAMAALAMYLWSRHSDRTRDRVWHLAIPAFAAAAALVVSAQLDDAPGFALLALAVSAMGIYAALPVFWTLPTALLTGSAAAAGIALVNSIGNLGGFLGPTLVGYARDLTGSYAASLWILAVVLALSGLASLALRERSTAARKVPPPLAHSQRAADR